MWSYEKRLEFPVNIKEPNAKLAQVIISQFGGPDGELSASMRYLSQRYSMPYREVAGLLTDIGTEELAHMEMVSAIVHQLTRNLSMEEIEKSGFATYYVDHTLGVWPTAAAGIPFNACEFQVKGDPITDLTEDLAADAATVQEQPKQSSEDETFTSMEKLSGTLGKLIKKFIFPVTGRSLGCLMECEEVEIHGKHYKRRTIGFD